MHVHCSKTGLVGSVASKVQRSGNKKRQILGRCRTQSYWGHIQPTHVLYMQYMQYVTAYCTVISSCHALLISSRQKSGVSLGISGLWSERGRERDSQT